jgi:SnoaL-like domain
MADTWTDRLDVLDAVHRFAAAIDERDWTAYRAAFTDEITIDYSTYRPGSAGPTTADAWVARASRLFPGLDATQHTITNARVTIAVDEAVCESYVRAAHALDGDVYTIAGHYTHHLVRAAPRWLIDHVTLRVAWAEGDRELLARGAARATT